MKNLILITLFLIGSISFDTDWFELFHADIFVDATNGNDANSGSWFYPVKTLAQAATLETSGVRIGLKSGEVWNESYTVAHDNVTLKKYGSGANPIISGFAAVTAWTNKGGNIWESANAVSTLTYLNIVLVNGVNTPMGRTPNSGSVYNADAVSNDVYVEASELTGTPDYTGAQIVMRKEAYAWQVANVTSQSTVRLNYTDVYSSSFTAKANMGFFIQAHAATLDQQNEWYYNTSTKKLQIYSTSEPTDVKVPTVDNLLSSSSKSYITVKNIEFTGANTNGLLISGGAGITVDNCNVNNIGLEGIYLYNITTPTITNNSLSNCNYSAIFDFGGAKSTDITITNNVVDSTYLIIGIGRLYPFGAIHDNCNTALIQYNTVTKSGYNGILFNGTYPQVRNNLIDSCMLKISDGGGIYSYNDSGRGAIVDGNIILNSIGYPLGEVNGYVGARGIYMDATSKGVTISNNSTSNCYNGINLASGVDSILVEDNLCFDSESSGFFMYNFSQPSGTSLFNRLNGNKFIALDATQNTAYFETIYDDIDSFLVASDSNYFARPLLEDSKTIRRKIGAANTYISLATWQTYSGLDANSEIGTNVTLVTDSVKFYYNATRTSSTVTLPTGTWVEVDGTEHTGSVTLQPYRSIVLVKGDYDVNYAILYNQLTSKPAIDTARFQNDLVVDLKAANVWSNADVIYVTAQKAEQGALLDWINPTGNNNVVNTTSAQFTAYEGFTGNTGTVEYLTTAFNPSTEGVNFLQNDAGLSAYCRLQVASAEAVVGTSSGSNYSFIRPNNEGSLSTALNTNDFSSYTNTVTQGLFTTVRRSSTEVENYINGNSVASGSKTSTGVPNNWLFLLGRSVTGVSNNQLSFVYAGGALSDTEVADMNTAVEKYMDSIGKGVQ